MAYIWFMATLAHAHEPVPVVNSIRLASAAESDDPPRHAHGVGLRMEQARQAAWLCTGMAHTAKAEALVTISCDKPEGSSITYGVSLTERVDAATKEQPEPTNIWGSR